MKNLFLMLLVAGFTMAVSSHVSVVNVDTEQSVVNWNAYKVTGEHSGTIQVKEGKLNMDHGKLVGGSFIIDMNSIKCTDMQGGGAAKLEGHLKSPDFFGVETYPEAKFEIKQVVSRGTAGSYKITGDLTIKETTKSTRFNVQLSEEDGVKTATADITLDRSDFDIRYGSGSFFDNLGDKTIYDEFDLSIRLVLE